MGINQNIRSDLEISLVSDFHFTFPDANSLRHMSHPHVNLRQRRVRSINGGLSIMMRATEYVYLMDMRQ